MARRFLDTNVLVYAEDPAAGAKGARAVALVAELMRAGDGVLSTQVLQEFFSICTRKLGLRVADVRERMETFTAFDLIPVSRERIFEAVDLHERHGLSFWDALIVRCAVAAKCTELLSEDLQDGQVIQGVRVVNPFR